MPREGDVSVNVPQSLIDRIEKVIEQDWAGYRSRDEFVRSAIRQRLEDVETRLAITQTKEGQRRAEHLGLYDENDE